MKPRARTAGLVLRELEGELLVYDLHGHHAHCLNRTAASVFRGCDGRTGSPELAARLRRELGIPADESWVRLAISRLSRAGLLEAGVTPMKDARRVSRRELVRRVGRMAGLALLLPTVTSIVAPKPAEAAATCLQSCSGQPYGTPCYGSNSGDCGVVCICNGTGSCVQTIDGVTPCP